MENTQQITGGYLVPLSTGQWKKRHALAHARIDIEMKERIACFKWSLSDQGYAYRTFRKDGKTCHEKMHRMILAAPANMMSDHINGDRLDNRISNLRLCTRAQNIMNSKKRKGNCTSKYRGVFFNKEKQRWDARIRADNKVTFIGRYNHEIEAALAFNLVASFIHGGFAKLNKIEA